MSTTSKGFASNYRIVLLATGLFVCFGGIGVRLVWLHVIERDSLLANIRSTRYYLSQETGRRGDILDAHGARMATSTSRIILGVDPSALKREHQDKWPQLAALINLPEQDLRRIFLTKYREEIETEAKPPASTGGLKLDFGAAVAEAASAPVSAEPLGPRLAVDEAPQIDLDAEEKGPKPIRWAVLAEEISEDLYARVLKLGIAGVYGQRGYRRVYPSNQLASHIVGYVNRQEEPVTGMEAHADFWLQAQKGWRVGEKDGRGRELAQYLRREVPRADGFTVKLSIDLTVQDIIEQELAYIMEKFQPLKATIIVSDPRTGFILGLANSPTFNPNEYNKVPKEEYARMKNAAVADIYEPGSVFKIVPAAAALEEGLVTPGTVFDCTLEKIHSRGVLVDMPDEDHRMGHLTVSEIISHSSNKGAAQLGLRLGEERLYNYAKAFGFARTLGFPVGGEVPGLLKPNRKWAAIDITRIPMGHSVSSTVLQMHQAMCVIANGGLLMRPQVLKEVRDSEGTLVNSFTPVVIHRAVRPETALLVAEMLTGVVRKPGGTAAEAAIEGFDVAGKTGTTQKILEEVRPDGRKVRYHSNKHHIASFVGFFPARPPADGRQVAISVVVDEARKVDTPSGVAYGRIVAAPSFKRIGERLIPILDIKSNPLPVRSSGLIAMHKGGSR